MGTVFLAADRNLSGHLVAIKENATLTPQTRQQFEREAVLLARLSHPNLPRVIDHFIDAGHQYLVMDYVRGKDLKSILRSRGIRPEAEVLGWIAQVMVALDYMHNWVDPDTQQPTPIIHRDIKPANMKCTDDGRIFLVDFGLAKISDGSSTWVGARGYTPGYSPTEQYSGITDQRSDIYALGATLYTLLTGQRPPEAPLIGDSHHLHPPRYYNRKLTPTTEQVILRAMALRAVDRYANVADMYQDLFDDPLPRIAHRVPRNRQSESRSRTLGARQHRNSVWLALLLIPLVFLLLFAWQWNGNNFLPSFTMTNGGTPTLTTAVVAISAATPSLNDVLLADGLTDASTETVPQTSTVYPTVTQTLVPVATATATNSVTPTAIPVSTSTPWPTPTRALRIEPSATSSGVIVPDVSPSLTSTPTKVPTPTRAGSTYTPVQQSTGVVNESLSTEDRSSVDKWVILREPTIGSRQGFIRFQWQSNFALASNEAFELIFWKPGETPSRNGLGFGGVSLAPEMTVNCEFVSLCEFGLTYCWGVLLVGTDPYERKEFLGDPNQCQEFRFDSSSGGGDSSCKRRNSAGECID